MSDTPSEDPIPASRLRRLVAALSVAAAAAALTVAPAAAASAAGSTTGSTTGWVRVAHLSPDTRQVDVRLAPLSGSGKVLELDDVAYGAVSKYWALPAGTYAVAMRPAGAADDAPPVVQTSVDVRRGTAKTVAVFGRNSDLSTRVVADDLRPVSNGNARVRLVQASVGDSPVTVTGNGGTVVARDAALATVTSYTKVRAGTWRLSTVQGSKRTTSEVAVEQGQIVSLFVLDRSGGDLVVRPVVDSAGVGATPKGFLATGGGYLVHRAQAEEHALEIGGLALAVLGAAAVAVAVRRRRARA